MAQNSRPLENVDLPEDPPGSSPPPEGPEKQPPKKRTMRLVSFNVNGWPPTAENAAMSATSASAASAASAAASASSKAARDRTTSAGLARWIGERLGADVLCLQETKISDRKLKDECKKLGVLKGYESFWSCSKPPVSFFFFQSFSSVKVFFFVFFFSPRLLNLFSPSLQTLSLSLSLPFSPTTPPLEQRTGYSGVATYCRSPEWSPTACFEGEEVLPTMHVFDHIPGGDAAVEALGLGASGASILSPPTYEGEGRYVETQFGDDLVVINVYVPNAGEREADGGVRSGVKVAFLRALRRRVDEILTESKNQGNKNRGVIVCGDFNVAVCQDDVSLDLTVNRFPEPMRFEDIYSNEERSALAALMAPPMVDAFRALNPEATARAAPAWRRGFTVWNQKTSARSRDEGLRIDFFLVSDNLRATRCEVVGDRRVVPWPWSDHAALLLEIEVAASQEGKEGGGGGAATTTTTKAEASSASSAAGAAAAAAAAPSSSPPPLPSSSRSLSSTPLLPRPPPPHEPIPQSSLRHQRWQPDPKQPTIFSMFGKQQKRAADEAEAAEARKAKK